MDLSDTGVSVLEDHSKKAGRVPYLVSNSMRLVSTGTSVSWGTEGQRGGVWVGTRRSIISPLALLQSLSVGLRGWGELT